LILPTVVACGGADILDTYTLDETPAVGVPATTPVQLTRMPVSFELDTPEPPAVPVVSACSTSWDRRPVLTFDALPAEHFYQLFLDDAAAAYAEVTAPGQNHHRPLAPIAEGAPPPGRPVAIRLRSCRGDVCAWAEPVLVSLVEACTAPVRPSAEHITFSEYVIDGDGACPGEPCEAGEAFEVTHISHCPVDLQGTHFSYCNNASCNAARWMNFGADAIVPPRGVYVAVRNLDVSTCGYPFMAADDPTLFGSRIATFQMQSDISLTSGWFRNSDGGTLRLATGRYDGPESGTTLALVAPYSGDADACGSIGFDAFGACGEPATMARLPGNQLGRLWRPCDAVSDAVPACER
jgi:hypothetical protein